MSAAEVKKVSMIDILRRLAVFADVADNRNFADNDHIITEWVTMKGSRELKAVLRVSDCRAAREFLKNIGIAQAKRAAELTQTAKAAFGDPSA